MAVGCSLTSPIHGQRSSELPQRATAPLAERRRSRVYVCFTFVCFVFFNFLSIPHTRIYFFPLRSAPSVRKRSLLQPMRHHAHHLIPQRAAVRLLPADLPHPHQRQLPVRVFSSLIPVSFFLAAIDGHLTALRAQ